MKISRTNIWELTSHVIVVGTNIGWDEHADPPMRNNMGAGLAAQARDRCPRLAWWYGLQCASWWLAGGTGFMPPVEFTDPKNPDVPLILAPVKPLAEDPAKSWDQKADYRLIDNSLVWIRGFCMRNPDLNIALPLIGAGNGELNPEQVELLVRKRLMDLDNVHLTDLR